jgi:hypothetical protein
VANDILMKWLNARGKWEKDWPKSDTFPEKPSPFVVRVSVEGIKNKVGQQYF